MSLARHSGGHHGLAGAPAVGALSLVVGSPSSSRFLLLSLFPGVFAPYDPLAFDYEHLSAPPSLAHPFGTDNFGRDVLSRVIWATRIDMQIALFCTIFPLVFGTVVGALTGFYGGWLDAVFGRLVDLVVTFPFLVIVIAIVAVLGPGLFNMYIAVSAVGWVFYAKLMRADVQVQKQCRLRGGGRRAGL